MEPFDLDVRGVGAFPTFSGRALIWLGGGEGEEQMAELANRLDDELFKVGFRKEAAVFRPT